MKHGTPIVKATVNARISAELKEQTIAACTVLGISITAIIVEAFKAKVKEAQKIYEKGV